MLMDLSLTFVLSLLCLCDHGLKAQIIQGSNNVSETFSQPSTLPLTTISGVTDKQDLALSPVTNTWNPIFHILKAPSLFFGKNDRKSTKLSKNYTNIVNTYSKNEPETDTSYLKMMQTKTTMFLLLPNLPPVRALEKEKQQIKEKNLFKPTEIDDFNEKNAAIVTYRNLTYETESNTEDLSINVNQSETVKNVTGSFQTQISVLKTALQNPADENLLDRLLEDDFEEGNLQTNINFPEEIRVNETSTEQPIFDNFLLDTPPIDHL